MHASAPGSPPDLLCAFQIKRTTEVDIFQTKFICSETAEARSRRRTPEARSFLEESVAPPTEFKCQPQKKNQTNKLCLNHSGHERLSKPLSTQLEVEIHDKIL